MPDITMCVNGMCEFRNECYRYRAVPDYWQSLAFFQCKKKEKSNFMPILEGAKIGDTDDCFKLKEVK